MPLVLLHGFVGEPGSWAPVLSDLALERDAFPEVYAADLASIPDGSLARASVFAVGYYRESRSDPPFPTPGSIGGCPAPRLDAAGLAGTHAVAWVDRVDRAIEEIVRTTGAPQVDLLGSSMGGVVARAYTLWRSERTGGRSRVRRLLILQSPNRGVNTLEAMGMALSVRPTLPWVRDGDVAEMARDHRAWQGRSYVERLNAGFDAFCASHGIAYGGLHGAGQVALNPHILQMAIDTVRNFSPVALAAAFVFYHAAAFDFLRDLGELMGPGDGLVRVSSASLAAGPEFPNALFDCAFRGLHIPSPWQDQQNESSTHSREMMRRFLLRGRLEMGANLVGQPTLRAIDAGGRSTWLLLDYHVAGSDGVSVQLFSEDLVRWFARRALPALGEDAAVIGAPIHAGHHRVALPPGPEGRRVLHLVFYDMDGAFAVEGPFFADVTVRSAGAEIAPETEVASALVTGPGTATLAIRSNAQPALFSWRVVTIGGAAPSRAGAPPPTAWSPLSSSSTVRLAGLPTGTHILEARAAHAANAASEMVEDATPALATIRVDGAGAVSVRY